MKKISVDAYEVAIKHISENRLAMDRIVEALCEKETLTGEREQPHTGVSQKQ